ncbi:MAG: hypothetical protein J6Y02_23700 [Pseudobutyrivibrio sp.]|nr:hypothetical protein [Pseudobutyrivibrio sp.]
MAYNNYVPQPIYQPVMPVNPFMVQQPQPSNDNIFVDGEKEANLYPVAPGKSAFLMDKNASVFYIKSVDQSGVAMPLRIFDYTERKSETKPEETKAKDNYATKDEFESFKTEIKTLISEIKQPKQKAYYKKEEQ